MSVDLGNKDPAAQSPLDMPTGPETTVSATKIPRVTVFDYNESEYKEWTATSLDVCLPPPKGINVRWINVDGVRNHDVVDQIGRCFGLHPLTIEDILNTGQQPKAEVLAEYGFIVARMFHHLTNNEEIISEQVSIVFGNRFVLSFQEIEGDVFDPIRRLIKEPSGRIRKSKADYLAYSLIDAIVDFYFVMLDEIGEKIEETQEQLIANPSAETLREIYGIKRKVVELRRFTWPVREVVLTLEREAPQLFDRTTLPYLRDLYDHVIQITDHIEIYREWLASMLDIYLSSVTNRLNEVIKFLTVLSTVVIPPLVISSWYGMNLVPQMPEVQWPFYYPLLVSLAVAMMIVMLATFRRRHWI